MRLCLPIITALIVPTSLIAQEPAAPLKLVSTISIANIPGRIDHFSLDLKGNVAYMAALGANTVVAIDLSEGKELGRISDLKEPQGVLYVPENGHLYVANGGDGTVRIYDAKTLKQLKTVALGDDADNVRYDAASKTVWVGYGNGSMAGLSLDGEKLVDIPVGDHPESFELEHRGSKLFVNVPRKKEVAVVDRATKKVLTTYGTGLTLGNYPMAFDEANERIFAGCRIPSRLLVLDAATGKVLANLDTVGNPDDLFYDAAKHRIYVLGGAGSVAIYSQNTPNEYTEIARVHTGAGGRTGLFIPEEKELLVAIPLKGTKDASVQVFRVQ